MIHYVYLTSVCVCVCYHCFIKFFERVFWRTAFSSGFSRGESAVRQLLVPGPIEPQVAAKPRCIKRKVPRYRDKSYSPPQRGTLMPP